MCSNVFLELYFTAQFTYYCHSFMLLSTARAAAALLRAQLWLHRGFQTL